MAQQLGIAEYKPLAIAEVKPLTPPPLPMPTERPKPTMSTVPDVMANAMTGVGQGMLKSLFGVTQLINRGTAAVGLTKPIDPRVFDAARQDIAPVNTPQRVGQIGEQIAELATPLGLEGFVAKTVTQAPRLARMGAKAGAGAVEFGAKAAAQTGGDPEDTATAALLGSANPAVTATISSIGRGVTHVLPEKLYQQIFKLTKDDVARMFQAGVTGQQNPTLAREVMERGVYGSARNMAVLVAKKTAEMEQQLQQVVQATAQTPARGTALVTIDLPDKAKFIGLLQDINQKFAGTFFEKQGTEAATLARKLKGIGGTRARAVDALEVKRFLDGMRNHSSFRLDPTLSVRQEELKVASDLVRAQLKTQVPAVRDLLNEQRIFIEAFDALVDDFTRRGNRQLLSLTDAILGGGGLASGFPGTGFGMMAAVRGFQQPVSLTGIGHGLLKFGQKTPSAGTVGRGVTAGAITAGRLVDKE